MSSPISELPGLWVNVDQVKYTENATVTPDRPYAFVYYITIHNDSDRRVHIQGRKWVITGSNGKTIVVEGDGVVGEFPDLAPNTKYHYNSYHLTDCACIATGAYFGVDEHGNRIMTRIPNFSMTPPDKLITDV